MLRIAVVSDFSFFDYGDFKKLSKFDKFYSINFLDEHKEANNEQAKTKFISDSNLLFAIPCVVGSMCHGHE